MQKKKCMRSLAIVQVIIVVISIISFSSIISSEQPPSVTNIQVPGNTAKALTSGWGVKKSFNFEVGDNTVSIEDLSKTSFEKTDSGGILKYGEESYTLTKEQTSELIKDGAITEVKEPGSSSLSKVFGAAQGSYWDVILSGAQWAVVAYGITQMVGPMFGLDDEQTDAASISAAAAFGSGKAVHVLLQKGGALNNAWGWGANNPGLASGGIGLAVGAAVFLATYKEESTKIIEFECPTWDAPTGGEHCEKCNNQPGGLPCSEYQCRSLGQACELLNPGTDEEKCVWVNRNDVDFPVITPWDGALLADYRYKPDNAISPPERGVIVVNEGSTDGCAQAFTPLSFGFTTNEPAKCKLSTERKNSFEDMDYYFGGSSLLRYNHSQVMSLPSPGALEAENLTIESDGNFEVFVRCQDANGNYNTADFVFKYCVQQGPDTTPPLIISTNLINGMPIAHDQSEIDIKLYVNEPSDCKWSHEKVSYDNMENSFSCSHSIMEMNAQMLYECSGVLDGIKAEEKNDFYFLCKDKPLESEDRIVNTEHYEFSIWGTKPLVIDEVGPNGTIKDSTNVVKITLEANTLGGFKEGYSTCYYSDTGESDDFIMFYYEEGTNNSDYRHEQNLWLPEGSYSYHIKCIDLGGNADTKIAEFYVETDTKEPMVIRAFKEESKLKIITDEEAKCVYDVKNCKYDFEDGTEMTSIKDPKTEEKRMHYVDWDSKKEFYIKCQDKYLNKPVIDSCSIIVRPFKMYEGED